jgi:hypothetical protein
MSQLSGKQVREFGASRNILKKRRGGDLGNPYLDQKCSNGKNLSSEIGNVSSVTTDYTSGIETRSTKRKRILKEVSKQTQLKRKVVSKAKVKLI